MLLKTLENKFNSHIFVKRYSALVIMIYYCVLRLDEFTWKFSDLALVWPNSVFKFDAVFLNQNAVALLIVWLISFVFYWIFLGVKSSLIFYFVTYLFVGRLNSYFSIERYDFSLMTNLLLSLLIPNKQEESDKKLFSAIIFMWQLLWVCLFFSAGIEKLRSTGFLWTDPDVLRVFIFRENYLQGPSICAEIFKVSILNYVLFSDFWLKFFLISTLMLELLYPVLLFSRRFLPFFLLVTFIFQISVKLFLNTIFFNYWLFTFIWFYSFKDQKFSFKFKDFK